MSSDDLAGRLEADLVTALKARDEVSLQVLRLLKAALKNQAIELKSDLSPQQMLQVLQKEAKKRQDSIDQYRAADRDDLVSKETHELAILKQYLPSQPSEAEVQKAVDAAMESAGSDAQMGQLITTVREQFAGAADGALIARLVQAALAEQRQG